MHVAFQKPIPTYSWEMGICWSHTQENKTKYRTHLATDSENIHDRSAQHNSKVAWVEDKESFKLSDVPSGQMKKTEGNNSKTKASEIKVLAMKSRDPSERKRSAAASIRYRPRNRWGGSVTSYFSTTNRKVDIDESLTYGTRRATLPATVVKRETKLDEETGEVFWEDNVKPLCGTLHNDAPRRKSQDWNEVKRNIRHSSLTRQSRRIEND